MNYMLEVVEIFPVVGLASVLVYLVIFLVGRRRGRRPRWPRVIAEFLLTGSTVAFVYVTQFMEFGNGMGDLINLEPLRSFPVAVKYGLVNAEGFTQVALNVLITVPIGISLPLVFPGRFERLRWVFLAGVTLAVATEALQLVTGRNADIDDVIANSAGTALGAALVVVVRAVAGRIPGSARILGGRPRVTTWRVTAAVATTLGVIAPFVTVVAINGGNRPGVVYYGHLQPSAVRVPGSISPLGAEANLYRLSLTETWEAVAARLRRQTGIQGGCAPQEDAWVCSGGTSRRFVVFPANNWSVSLNYRGASAVDPATVPDEKTGVRLARAHLASFQIDADTLSYAGVDRNWADGYLHLRYTSRERDADTLLWGKVSVTLGEKGKLVELDDARVHVERVRSVKTVSPRVAIATAQEIGAGFTTATASVLSVTASYYFDEDSGYLIPVWNIQGTLPNGNGQVIDWNPVIDARSG